MQIFNKIVWSFQLVFFIMISEAVYCQIPSTEIYLIDLKITNNKIKFCKPVKVTENPGYDNQPYFTEDSKYLYYASITDNKQADIYRLDIASGLAKQVTHTEESEYSPTPIMGSSAITTVRVDMDSTQRLYEIYPFSRKPPTLLFSDIKDIGYHCWLNENYVAMFRLEETFNLYVANRSNKRIEKADNTIGRCLQRIPETNNLSYVSKSDSLNWMIKEYDLRYKTIKDIAPVYNQNEDFAWISSNQLIMGDKGVFYTFNMDEQKWRKAKDLNSKLGNFYRIHINSDKTKMAVVTYTGDKP